MEVTGKVIKVLEKIEGTTPKGDWWKQTFIVKTEAEYNNLYPIDAFKKEVPQEGEQVTVYFNIDAREWEGRYFTNLSLWKYDVITPQISAPAPTLVSSSVNDDLPF